jgi:YcaO cyclodehydratase, ATP-ad Mg2+-binding
VEQVSAGARILETSDEVSISQLLSRIAGAHSPSPTVTFFDDAVGSDLCHVLIEQEGRQGKGYGIGSSAGLALLKAYSEWLERGVFYELAKPGAFESTNGFAAHPHLEQAEAAARLELIERDAFLTCWHARRPPRWLSACEVERADPSGWLRSQQILLRDNGLDLSLGIVGMSLGACVVVSALKVIAPSLLTGGVAVLTSASLDLGTALQHVVETQRAIATVALNRIHRKAHVDVNRVEAPVDLIDHFLTPPAAAGISWYFDGSEEPVVFPKEEIAVQWFRPHAAWDITVARATSPSMQQYYGVFQGSPPVNRERLLRVFPGLEEVNEQQHPLS